SGRGITPSLACHRDFLIPSRKIGPNSQELRLRLSLHRRRSSAPSWSSHFSRVLNRNKRSPSRDSSNWILGEVQMNVDSKLVSSGSRSGELSSFSHGLR